MPPFTAHRRDGKLILEIDEQRFLADATGAAGSSLRVLDREQFIRFALANIFSLTHDVQDGSRASWWQRLTESLGKAAAATGEGLRQDEATPPTCGCDPEEHDGG